MKKTIVIPIILIVLFSSCKSLLLDIVTPSNVNRSLKIMQKENNKIIFLPMVHVAKKKFFKKVKKIVDSLKKENYTVFYEGIEVDNQNGKKTKKRKKQ